MGLSTVLLKMLIAIFNNYLISKCFGFVRN